MGKTTDGIISGGEAWDRYICFKKVKNDSLGWGDEGVRGKPFRKSGRNQRVAVFSRDKLRVIYLKW